MERKLEEFDVVRVIDDARGIVVDARIGKRRPRVGDLGCVTEILSEPGRTDRVFVECAEDASLVWLAEFPPEALELVE